jgi:hypothetical protein
MCPARSCQRRIDPKELQKLLPRDNIVYAQLKDVRQGRKYSCHTPKCLGGFSEDNGLIVAPHIDEGEDNPAYRQCVECGLRQCVLCDLEHTKGTCAQTKAEWEKSGTGKDLPDFKTMKIVYCPKCRAPIEKKDLCDNMTCKCGHKFNRREVFEKFYGEKLE